MKTFLPTFGLAALMALVPSCQLDSPLAASRSDFKTAADQESVKLGHSATALIGKGSSFSASPLTANAIETETPAIVLREGKVVVVKQHDGEVCDIIAGPAWARLVGTTVLAEKRGSILRVIIVEGRARVNWGNRLGEYRMLTTGQMLMVDETQKTLPNPVLVNLRQLLTREELLSPGLLGSEKLARIEEATKDQAARLAAGTLVVRNPIFAATGSPESMVNGDSSRNSRPVTTRVNTLVSQTLGDVGTTVGGVTGAVDDILHGLLGGLH